MKKIWIIVLFIPFIANGQKEDPNFVKALFDTALSNQQGHEWLRYLCKEIGARPSGSQAADEAAYWTRDLMMEVGFDTAWLQPVRVPHWVRGSGEKGMFHLKGEEMELSICALGGSIPTPADGLRAKVFEVDHFSELQNLDPEKVRGKWLFLNEPMDPKFLNTGFAYGTAGVQRWAGAVEAARLGAVGVIVRSLTLRHDDHPHTGSMSYSSEVEKIPASAISTMDAEMLSNYIKLDPDLEVSITLTCQDLGMTTGYNVIADVFGSEKPDEIVVVGGHLDSWDMAEGAQDDGVGSMQSIESVWLLLKAGYQPRRTHRVVLFMNEEFGLNGARKYAEWSREKGVKNVIGMESDSGSGIPRGFSIQGTDSTVSIIRSFREALLPYGLFEFSQGGSGADIGQLQSDDVILLGFRPDNQRYFDYHHAVTDVFESVHPREFELGSASMAAMLYLLDVNLVYAGPASK
ncbi:MAG: M28 family peptidase [Bacteroidota bacterium]|nr:M28 family peptidase [Bacteroidota bacterium]